MFSIDLLNRFWAKVEIKDTKSCWNWIGAINSKGYGVFGVGVKLMLAHRFSFEIHNGEIPIGLLVLHTCDNRRCVNPDHLFLGNHQDNMNDMVTKGRQAKGEKNGRSKISSEDADTIPDLYAKGGYTYRKLGELFNISTRHVGSIINHDNWN